MLYIFITACPAESWFYIKMLTGNVFIYFLDFTLAKVRIFNFPCCCCGSNKNGLFLFFNCHHFLVLLLLSIFAERKKKNPRHPLKFTFFLVVACSFLCFIKLHFWLAEFYILSLRYISCLLVATNTRQTCFNKMF